MIRSFRSSLIAMFSIGPYSHPDRVIVAPMAGVTDQPFRNLCRRFGSYWAVSEMVTSDRGLWHTSKSRHRLDHSAEEGISWVQLAGSEPNQLADAARANVELGAQIIDINMGCPAKKVCNKAAGSALLRDTKLVGKIVTAVVEAVSVPVTLKIRLGWSREEVNASEVARIAENAGVKLLTVHGRTRACKFGGDVDYEAIAQVKQSVTIPVIANGDITCARAAQRVLAVTGCDGVMIGRAAQGKPWLPANIDRFLRDGQLRKDPEVAEIQIILRDHISALHDFYGDYLGVRIARKHVGWTLDKIPGGTRLKRAFNLAENSSLQFQIIDEMCELTLAA